VGESWAGGANLGTGSDNTKARARVFMIGSLVAAPQHEAAFFTERFSQNQFF